MFEQWKRAWQEAVDNFWRELGDAGTGAPAERATAMRRDLKSARGEIERVESDLVQARRQLDKERDAEQSCRRREALARGIGDDETARVAAEYAARHDERAGVLEQKARALEAELTLRRRDIEEMETALREIEAAAGVGGGDAGQALEDDVDDRTFRRMEREQREREAERRLEELKRKMR